MKRRPTEKLLSLILLLALLCGLLGGCGEAKAMASLSFAAANSINEIKALDGREVTIVGYMATLSPPDGKYMYLMNLPYQSCPFCIPNTQQLANTMAVYAKSGKSFTFTDQAVRVTGTMKLGHYSDDYGYEYEYRIVDAVTEPVDMSTVGKKYALWTSLASDGVVGEIYSMFDYLHFVCQWSDYLLNYTDENGQAQQAYMYAGDVLNFLQEDAPYGYKKETEEGYFDELIKRVRAVSARELNDLVDILNKCRKVRDRALDDLYTEKYTYDADTDRFKQTNYDELYDLWFEVYSEFTVDWLNQWQL